MVVPMHREDLGWQVVHGANGFRDFRRTVRRRNALLQGRSKMEDRRGAPRRALMMR
jgi:hypothetical protein